MTQDIDFDLDLGLAVDSKTPQYTINPETGYSSDPDLKQFSGYSANDCAKARGEEAAHDDDEPKGFFAGVVNYAIEHPFLTAIALAPWAKMASDAIKKQQLIQDTAVKFYTRNLEERSDYFAKVHELERTGKYKLAEQGYRDGGYYWELHRRDI